MNLMYHMSAKFSTDYTGPRYQVASKWHMWNVSISILSSSLANQVNVHHNVINPIIIIITNGDDLCSQRQVRHFSGTQSKQLGKKSILEIFWIDWIWWMLVKCNKCIVVFVLEWKICTYVIYFWLCFKFEILNTKFLS